MSKITTAYNALLTAVGVLFPSKTRIFDPYDLSNNPSHYLRDSWGVKKNGMEAGANEICNITEVHNYSIILVREIVRLEAETTLFDVAYLALEEDVVLLRQRLFSVDQILVGSSIRSIDLSTVSGVEINYFEKGIFISMEVNFNISITEEL